MKRLWRFLCRNRILSFCSYYFNLCCDCETDNKMDPKFLNVIMLGFGFMFLFTAFQTMGNIEQTVIDSIHNDDETFTANGYTSLAIIYAVFSLFNWVTPSILSKTGPKGAMLIGAATYCLFIVSFFWPKTWLLYMVSAILGAGAALIWTGQGTYLSRCSNEQTISRNSGIFWAMLQASMFLGNLFVYFQFQGKEEIDLQTRTIVFSVLTAVALLGVIFLVLLRSVPADIIELSESSDGEISTPVIEGPVKAFKGAVRLFLTKDMLLLSVCFLYTGFALSFYSGVYSPSIGFTLKMGDNVKQLVGMSGVFIGVGEVLGGLIFGLLGSKTNKYGRNPIVFLGFLVHIMAYILIFLNLPNDAPFGGTDNISVFDPPIAEVAIFCSFLLGFGDACYNTQIYTMLGGVFAKNTAAAFSIFKFTQSVAAASSFGYSSSTVLRIQIAILLAFAVIGTLCFTVVEWGVRRRADLNSQDASNKEIMKEK